MKAIHDPLEDRMGMSEEGKEDAERKIETCTINFPHKDKKTLELTLRFYPTNQILCSYVSKNGERLAGTRTVLLNWEFNFDEVMGLFSRIYLEFEPDYYSKNPVCSDLKKDEEKIRDVYKQISQFKQWFIDMRKITPMTEIQYFGSGGEIIIREIGKDRKGMLYHYNPSYGCIDPVVHRLANSLQELTLDDVRNMVGYAYTLKFSRESSDKELVDFRVKKKLQEEDSAICIFHNNLVTSLREKREGV
ncbi:MAG: hypothetical protein V1743_05155 [Nanoarchaeota archaeon]